MKRLLNEEDCFMTDVGIEFANEIEKPIKQIFEKYQEQGYNLSDMLHIIMLEANSAFCFTSMMTHIDLTKKKLDKDN